GRRGRPAARRAEAAAPAPTCEEAVVVDLHERLTTARPAVPLAGRDDPFAELKNRVHMAVIGVLGPRLFNANLDPATLREQVLADTRRHLAQEGGLSRDDRERLASEIADDALGHGP